MREKHRDIQKKVRVLGSEARRFSKSKTSSMGVSDTDVEFALAPLPTVWRLKSISLKTRILELNFKIVPFHGFKTRRVTTGLADKIQCTVNRFLAVILGENVMTNQEVSKTGHSKS